MATTHSPGMALSRGAGILGPGLLLGTWLSPLVAVEGMEEGAAHAKRPRSCCPMALLGGGRRGQGMLFTRRVHLRFAAEIHDAPGSIIRRMGRKLQHLRCFLRIPPGHKWAIETEDQQSFFMRCQECGKSKRGRFTPGGDDPSTFSSLLLDADRDRSRS